MRIGLFILLNLMACLAYGQQGRKQHFLAGPRGGFSGYTITGQSGFYYDYNLSLDVEYSFLQNTSAGIRLGIDGSKSSVNRNSSFLIGPFVRQYLWKGLNVQASFTFRDQGRQQFGVGTGYGFEAGRRTIVQPELEYLHNIPKGAGDAAFRFGLSLRFILGEVE